MIYFACHVETFNYAGLKRLFLRARSTRVDISYMSPFITRFREPPCVSSPHILQAYCYLPS
jgi:hypothetical protein